MEQNKLIGYLTNCAGPIIGWLFAVVGSLLILVLWVLGLINAIGGNMTPVPVLGDKFEEWFSSIS